MLLCSSTVIHREVKDGSEDARRPGKELLVGSHGCEREGHWWRKGGGKLAKRDGSTRVGRRHACVACAGMGDPGLACRLKTGSHRGCYVGGGAAHGG